KTVSQKRPDRLRSRKGLNSPVKTAILVYVNHSKGGVKDMTQKNLWDNTDLNVQAMDSLCEDYKACLAACKTARECGASMKEGLQAAGCLELCDGMSSHMRLKPGDLVCTDMTTKALRALRIRKRPITEGMRMLGAQIDSPRLNIKRQPL